ncbi:M15 family metallopeptidase [Desulfosporosinus sp. FKA]|uniref:M15 family metallopeptidase n=1 Tax=Desulfosporosinus sp. FKA TaxID=1969834 RepID=UPI000B4A1341|nr:M15 family metallopeptidase [Desulfosporosinus sp. FKA]
MAYSKYIAEFVLMIVLTAFIICGCAQPKNLDSSAPKNTIGSKDNGNFPDSNLATSSPKGVDPGAQTIISVDDPLTCGQFVWLLLKQKDSLMTNTSEEQVFNSAKSQEDIPSDININESLTWEKLAYLITYKNKSFANIDESHYDWQITDFSAINPTMKKYVLMSYARGLIHTENGEMKPKGGVYLSSAQTIIARMNQPGKLKLPPDQAAPYFEYKGLVDVKRLAPSIKLDLKYATKDNFTKVAHYSRVLCLLEATTAKKLAKANEYFHKQGYTIKIWDAYRPVSVQWSLYNATPQNLKQYAPAPSKYSQHSKGIAVDLTLVDKDGNEIAMPTGFDNFTERAHIDYDNLPKQVLQNRTYLCKGMEQQGFNVNTLEWWHYFLSDKSNLEKSDVSLDEFAQKEKEFYINYLKNYRD